MKKQTAVEWLMNQMLEGSMDTKTGDLYIKLPKHSFEQAKAMEREQIIDAVEAGYQIANEDERFKHIQTHGQYYNKTYKGGEQ